MQVAEFAIRAAGARPLAITRSFVKYSTKPRAVRVQRSASNHIGGRPSAIADKLHVAELSGAGTPLVFLHSVGGTRRYWLTGPRPPVFPGIYTTMIATALACMFTRRVIGKLLPYLLRDIPRSIAEEPERCREVIACALSDAHDRQPAGFRA